MNFIGFKMIRGFQLILMFMSSMVGSYGARVEGQVKLHRFIPLALNNTQRSLDIVDNYLIDIKNTSITTVTAMDKHIADIQVEEYVMFMIRDVLRENKIPENFTVYKDLKQLTKDFKYLRVETSIPKQQIVEFGENLKEKLLNLNQTLATILSNYKIPRRKTVFEKYKYLYH
uniref:Uncharacterized protein n=1 Tax=Clastoptera arizonana TaxID=38151 RepID=A0A1B6D6R6_9HEMI